ncbi:DUF4296 domain-containing protein [Flavobacterium aurantiibacter]|uniref:DUF4296 domain-containing protein n=1 Tax=Flavobacterium aurantiibacter TaxID=2023067 RepID=A0A255ZTS1_9FLAO|nr:DUF4296 domain-containing protein [Flavobacterium aurantiibacter]OYQ44789.1 hypothetical protein CHX27_07170 [Flavobacterium aurantiibacter]
MKKLVIVLLLGTWLYGCQSSSVPEPENLIDEEDMVEIYYDMQVYQAIDNSMPGKLAEENIVLPESVFKKHQVTKKQFEDSDYYYAQNIKKYKKIFEEVKAKLEEQKESLKEVPQKPLPKPKS